MTFTKKTYFCPSSDVWRKMCLRIWTLIGLTFLEKCHTTSDSPAEYGASDWWIQRSRTSWQLAHLNLVSLPKPALIPIFAVFLLFSKISSIILPLSFPHTLLCPYHSSQNLSLFTRYVIQVPKHFILLWLPISVLHWVVVNGRPNLFCFYSGPSGPIFIVAVAEMIVEWIHLSWSPI